MSLGVHRGAVGPRRGGGAGRRAGSCTSGKAGNVRTGFNSGESLQTSSTVADSPLRDLERAILFASCLLGL